MKAVVTGGGGFLGRHIVDELLGAGKAVTVIARGDYPELTRRGVNVIKGDVRDGAILKEIFAGVDEVFHVAAKVGVWGNWKDFFETNVVGTQNVIDACQADGVSRLIYTSSPSVIFDGSDHRGVNETYPYPNRWLASYPRSKKIAEERVLAANGKRGLYTVALRPHLIWGKGDPHLIPRVIEQGRAGKLRRVGRGANKVDIVHVRNAARAHLQAAECLGEGLPCSGRVYFLSQGAPVVLWDFINEVLRREKIPPVTKKLSFGQANAIGAILEIGFRIFKIEREPRMTRFLAHTLANDHYYDISAARADFAYSPYVTTEAGLDEMFS